MGKFIDLTGKTFERLTANSYYKNEKGVVYWECTCSCGNTSKVRSSDIRSGKQKSCGCLKNEKASERFKTHGMSASKEYRHYAGMLSRCTNPNHPDYEHYTARGITVCQAFLDDFLNFYNEIGPKPTGKWSVGRIDNTRGYEIGNVRWETDEQQARNHSLQKNNTSGVAGITLRYTENDGDRVVARYNGLDGKRRSKSFSIGRFGKEVAMRLAVEWRETMIKSLIEQGADYGEFHGKPDKYLED